MAVTPNIGLTEPVQGTTPWDTIVNGNMTIIDNCFGGTQTVPAIAVTALQPTLITKYNGVTTVAGGVPALVAKADLTAQAANIADTTLYAVPANGAGMYRVSSYVVVTQAATVSSTMPSTAITWTDNDTGVAVVDYNITPTNTNNVVGLANILFSTGVQYAIINVKASTNIRYGTANYASSGATPMQYAIHVKLEYLGL